MEEELGPQTLTLVRLTETDKKMMEWDCGAYTVHPNTETQKLKTKP